MSGPGFGFSWCNAGETFGPTHQVYQENVFSFTVTGTEGECPKLSLVLRNPRIGLLNAGRSLWCWLSSTEDGVTFTPIYHGRLVGIPSDIFGELVTLEFIAKPLDYSSQRRALALSLAESSTGGMVYDPLFIDPELRVTADGKGDPNVVLEAIASRWHVSRGEDGGALTVTASDITEGEDGTLLFEAGSDGVAYDSISLTFDAPKTAVTVKAQVDWTQTGAGPAIDLGHHTIETYTQSLLSDWPKPGVSLGGGWQAAPGTVAVDLYGVDNLQTVTQNINWQNAAKQHVTGDAMSLSVSDTEVVCQGSYFRKQLTETFRPGVVDVGYIRPDGLSGTTTNWDPDENGDVINIPMHYDSTWVVVPMSKIYTSLFITYEAGRKRTEHLNFTMTSDIQPVLTLPGDYDTSQGDTPPDEDILEITGGDVTVPIDGMAPLTDPQAGHYFTTERGLQSIEYLLLRARAVLLAGARIVKLSWGCSFARALELTCRKSATLIERRLPGGQATGKIVGYTIFADGSTVKRGGTINVACTVGHGGSVSAAAGINDYVEDDYIESDAYSRTGEIDAVGTDVGYGWPDVAMDEDTLLPFTKEDVVVSETIHGSAAAQLAIIQANAADWYKSGESEFQDSPWWIQQWARAVSRTPDTTLQTLAAKEAAAKAQDELDSSAVWYELKLRSVDQLALENAIDLTIEPLKVVKTIDLEAASNAD